MHSHDPLAVLPSHFPSGLSVIRIISICSPCLKLSSFFPPLTSQQAFAWWMTWIGPVSCKEEKKSRPASLLFRTSLRNAVLKDNMSTTCQPAYYQHLQVWTRSWGWMSFLVNVLRGGVRGKLQRSDRTSKEQVSTCSGARREWQWSVDLGNSVEDLQRKPPITEYHLCTNCWVLCVFMGYAGGLLDREIALWIIKITNKYYERFLN